MDRRSMAVASLALTLVLAMALPMGAVAKGKPTTEATNNLSVPTIMLARRQLHRRQRADVDDTVGPGSADRHAADRVPDRARRLLLRAGRAQVAGPVLQHDRHGPAD